MAQRKRKWTYLDHAYDQLERHIANYDRHYREKDRLPKNTAWRPRRICVRDMVLGWVVFRHNWRANLLDVDVCLSADLHQFEQFNGAKIVALTLLTEAFMCGGSMEIKFTKNVLNGRVPPHIYDLALEYEIELKHVLEGHITPYESRQLYLALTGFSEAAERKIRQLAVEEKVSPERICFMIHHGVWTLPEMESILLGSKWPERIILGSTPAELRHLFLNDLLHARAALLGSFLDRKLTQREEVGETKASVELEAEERRIDIVYDSRFYAKVYNCHEAMPVPWVKGFSEYIPPGEQLVVMVRPRRQAEFCLFFDKDLSATDEMKKAYQQRNGSVHFSVLVPRDFEDIPNDERKTFLEKAEALGVHVMVCPETVTGLDSDAMSRLAQSRILRR